MSPSILAHQLKQRKDSSSSVFSTVQLCAREKERREREIEILRKSKRKRDGGILKVI